MTHDEKVLALLADGKPHTHRELYGLHVVAHSRVASLRKKGYAIRMWRAGDDYLYQLSPLDEPASAVADSSSGARVSGTDAAAPLQLKIEAA